MRLPRIPGSRTRRQRLRLGLPINPRTVRENNMTCRCGAIDCPSCCPDSFVRSGGRMFYADDLDDEELEADIIADEEYEVNQTIDREQRTRDD